MTADPVDALLERYLALLDEYTQLRARLSTLQSAMFQSIARANFAAERGMRYGQDHYDERMQAARRVRITDADAAGIPGFETIQHEEQPRRESEVASDKEEVEKEEGDASAHEENEQLALRKRDPLRWFGLFTPMPLRQAQSQAVEAVETVIPKLVSVSAEMFAVEIEVRRARKRRANAQVSQEKQAAEQDQKQEVPA
ncbi:hypothetical protein GQ53DRAFT_71433 [Thozetella sp. PMI_491]|nr:hypothetical protein GQ53DRAFT_71433 [Thozetella sp. PMI_491]